MSDWWSIIIVILIIIIIFDGFRRARAARKNSVRLSKNARKADKLFGSESTLSSKIEEPVGKVRVKVEAQPEQPINASDDISSVPHQANLELDDPVPMLMESVESEGLPAEPETHLEPSIGDLDVLDQPEVNESFEQMDSPDSSTSGVSSERKNPLQKAADYFNREPASREITQKPDIEKQKPEDQSLVSSSAEEILIINVMARSGETFNGQAILDVLTDLKLKFGQMGIFHRYYENDGDAASIFSVANIVEPGVFDLSTISTIESPGLCMFLPLPSAVPAIEAYENLIETAQALASLLGGDVKDENRSAMTNQTIEHGRQRVMEFERKYQLRK